jgi:HlyD family secretion protein
MTKRFRLMLFTLAIPIAALAMAAYWVPGMLGGGQPTLTYDTVEVTKGAIRKIVSTSGPVRALVTVQVGSQLSGQIGEVRADFNTEVKAGDVLAVLDVKTFAARVAQARADLNAAKASLTNQQAAIARAEANLRQAERALDRQTQLSSRGVTSQASLDTATRDLEVAQADLAVARAQVGTAEATVAQRQAQLDQAEIDLERTQIRSPIDGTVISRTVDIGQTVAASFTAPELFKIAQDLRRIRIEAQVNEADVGAVAEGNPVTFTVDAYPERKFEGRVTQVRLSATELNNIVTYTVIVEASNEDRRLYPGMTANVQIETSNRDNALRISNDALRYRPRDSAANAPGQGSTSPGRGMMKERLERLKSELSLTPDQVTVVEEEMRKVFAEMRGDGGFGNQGPGGNWDQAQVRARIQSRLEQALTRILTDAQRPAFEKWKTARRDQQVVGRTQAVWVLGPEGPERRVVQLGIADDVYTEVVGGSLKSGDRAITRAREARK